MNLTPQSQMLLSDAAQSRRDFLTTSACGLGSVALSSMLLEDGLLGAEYANPMAPRQPHFELGHRKVAAQRHCVTLARYWQMQNLAVENLVQRPVDALKHGPPVTGPQINRKDAPPAEQRAAALDQLALQRREEALAQRVVVAVPHTAH